MQLLLIGLGSIALVFGSLVTAVALCWLLWFLFRLLGHPAWAASAIFVLLMLACTGRLPPSQFLQMVLMFAALGTIPLWTEGRAWRRAIRKDASRRRRAAPARAAPANAVTQHGHGLYPAIVACIGEDRRAERAEIRMVAARIWRETYLPQLARSNTAPSFALRRRAVRAAKCAMSGQIQAHR